MPRLACELAFVETFVMARWRQRRSWDLKATNFNAEIVSQISAGQADSQPSPPAKPGTHSPNVPTDSVSFIATNPAIAAT